MQVTRVHSSCKCWVWTQRTGAGRYGETLCVHLRQYKFIYIFLLSCLRVGHRGLTPFKARLNAKQGGARNPTKFFVGDRTWFLSSVCRGTFSIHILKVLCKKSGSVKLAYPSWALFHVLCPCARQSRSESVIPSGLWRANISVRWMSTYETDSVVHCIGNKINK